jgi:hypothetical protein
LADTVSEAAVHVYVVLRQRQDTPQPDHIEMCLYGIKRREFRSLSHAIRRRFGSSELAIDFRVRFAAIVKALGEDC